MLTQIKVTTIKVKNVAIFLNVLYRTIEAKATSTWRMYLQKKDIVPQTTSDGLDISETKDLKKIYVHTLLTSQEYQDSLQNDYTISIYCGIHEVTYGIKTSFYRIKFAEDVLFPAEIGKNVKKIQKLNILSFERKSPSSLAKNAPYVHDCNIEDITIKRLEQLYYSNVFEIIKERHLEEENHIDLQNSIVFKICLLKTLKKHGIKFILEMLQKLNEELKSSIPTEDFFSISMMLENYIVTIHSCGYRRMFDIKFFYKESTKNSWADVEFHLTFNNKQNLVYLIVRITAQPVYGQVLYYKFSFSRDEFMLTFPVLVRYLDFIMFL